MPGEYPRDLVFADLFPAGTGGSVIDHHETGMQIAGECKACVEEQRDAVIAVTGCVEDLTVEPDTGKKFSTVLDFQNEIIVLCNRDVGEPLPLKNPAKGGMKSFWQSRRISFMP